MLWGKFREGATEAGKDPEAMATQLQVHVSWAPTQQEAEDQALREWPNGGMPFPKQDIKNPEDFENMAKLVRIEHFANRMLISADLDEHLARCRATSTWASTRSSCTTWGATRPSSSPPSARRCFPGSACPRDRCPSLPPDEARRRLAAARIARLATVRADGAPHLVPVVFAFDGEVVRTIADPKPKRGLTCCAIGTSRPIPAVSLLVDEYEESWAGDLVGARRR